MIGNLSRVMFAIGRLKATAAALTGSWLLVIVADVLLAELIPARWVVAALALGNTVGQTIVAIPLVLATRRICGRAAVQGTGHAALAGPPGPWAPGLASPSAWSCLSAGSCRRGRGGRMLRGRRLRRGRVRPDRGDLRTVVARLRTRLRAS